MALNYNTTVEALRNLAVTPESGNDSYFEQIVPRAIDYAEQRLYREFDFLCTLGSQTATLTANNRTVALPSNVIVAQSANIITPAATQPDSGTRNPVTRTSVEFLNGVYNSVSGAGLPKYYAIIGAPSIGTTITAGSYSILLGPWPDQAYVLELIGTVRPTPLSSANATTFLTNYIPDIFIAACMIFIAGYQRDFGQQSDDPQLAQSWENQYQLLVRSANAEELRRKSASVEWTTMSPTPPANTPRDRGAP